MTDDLGTPQSISDENVFQNGALKYEFKGDIKGPRTITYKTKVADGLEYRIDEVKYSNTAYLKKGTTEAHDSGEVTFPALTWISKKGELDEQTGTKWDPENRTITWYIEVNQPRATLEDITITDVLDNRLEFLSAQWQKNIASGTEPVDWQNTGGKITEKPDQDKYIFEGTTSDHMRLVITTKIKTGAYIKDKETIGNTASLTWKDKKGDGISAKSPTLDVGFNVLNKSGSFDKDWNSNHLVNWEIKLNFEGQMAGLGNFKIYDLLVHASSDKGTFSNSNHTLEDQDGNPVSVDDEIWSKLTPQYGQRYNAVGTDTSGLTVTPIKVMDNNGNYVADLIEISGFNDDKEYTVNFSSKVLDLKQWIQNGTANAKNTAALFEKSNDQMNFVTDADASVWKSVNVLKKDILKSVSDESTLTGEGSYIGNSGNGFNHTDKTAFFRLKINESKQNLTDKEFSSSPINVTDQLPSGWVFDQTYNKKGYKIFNGTSLGEELTGSKDPVTNSSSIFGKNGDNETATFTFDTLTEEYVILIKAKLTDTEYENYIANNATSKTVTNTATLSSGGEKAESTANVTVKTGVVSKEINQKKNGILQWTINYNPRVAEIVSQLDPITVKDTLGTGFELYLDNDFKPDTSNIFIEEMVLNPDGNLTPIAKPINLAPELVAKGKVTYDIPTRELRVVLPDGKKPYRITYLTMVTGEENDGISNSVKVEGVTAKNNQSSNTYKISQSDASASMVLGGYLRIKKVDAANTEKGLSDAVFGLFTNTGKQLREGKTDENGILRFGALRPATYILKELAPPNGYKNSPKEYTVTVEEKDPNAPDSAGKLTIIWDGSTKLGEFDKDTPSTTATAITNHPSGAFGDLTIKKIVAGNGGESDKAFDFTVILGTEPDTVYSYTGNGIPGGTMKSGGIISLKGGQSITFYNLPAGTEYSVEEKNYSKDGYDTPAVEGEKSGAIQADQEKAVVFTNTRHLPGSLIIKKAVAGNSNETGPFEFTVTFTKPDGAPDKGLYDYSGTNGNGKISSGDKFSLAHNQSIIITGLPKDTVYTVTEDDYSGNGYTTSPDHATGVIDTDKEQTVSFTNTKWLPGSLTIKKTVAGNAEENIKFDFTITLTKPDGTPDDGEYSYSGTGGTGTISNGGHISLAHGQSITITGLPKDTVYKVTENNHSESGYTMSSDHASGTIVTNDEQTASFTNTKWQPGSLTISKTVTGSGSDTKKKFDFTVTFTAAGSYPYTGNGVDNGIIKSGDTISLADGESITITGLPAGTGYQVTEADYSDQRYSTSKTGDTGTIDTLVTSTAAFTNTYHKRSGGGGGGGGGNNGPRPIQPRPTAPTAPTEPDTSVPTPKEEMPPQEVYDVYGEVPRGYMIGPDNKIHTPQEIYDIWGQVPLGYMVGINGQLVPLGLPKTGDGRPANMAVHVLFGVSILLGIFASAIILRKDKETDI